MPLAYRPAPIPQRGVCLARNSSTAFFAAGWCSGSFQCSMSVAFGARAITHVLLFVGYALYKAGVFGNTGLLVYAGVISFTPLILAACACPLFKPESLRPVLASVPEKVEQFGRSPAAAG